VDIDPTTRQALSDDGRYFIERVITLLPEKLRPEVIRLETSGEPLILLRVPSLPHVAFLVWGNHQASERVQLAINTSLGIAEGVSIVSASSWSMHYDTSQRFPSDFGDIQADGLRRTVFATIVYMACERLGIRHLLISEPHEWLRWYGGITGSILEPTRETIEKIFFPDPIPAWLNVDLSQWS
jgi:hypothetical protein